MLSIDLRGRLALITGATSELGRAMVRTIADAGADIIVHYHKNNGKAESLANEVRAGGRKSLVVQADVTNKDSVQTMYKAVCSGMRTPDIVVTNAVIQYGWTTVLDQPETDYETQFGSCVMQNVLLAKAFVPGMIENGWGRIVGINTECAMQNWKNQSAYVSGKRGMDGVLRVLAKEIGASGITVNQVAPGWTVSENRPDSEEAKSYRDDVPLARRGTAHEIANVVAFLASDLASFITGAYIPVCGGNVMPAI